MTNHTPGPWHWDSDPIKGDPLQRSRYRVCTRGKTITQMYYANDDQAVSADTKLIAAAPDLLNELLTLRQFSFFDRWGGKGFDDEAQALFDRVNRVIAAAGYEPKPGSQHDKT